MTEWIVTASVLILVVIILRTVLKGKISLRLQYALWALVLVRLLIPGSLFNSPVSVMNAVPNEPAGFHQEEPVQEAAPPVASSVPAIPNTPAPVMPNSPLQSDAPGVTLTPVVTPEEPAEIPWGQVVRTVWYVGMAAMALCLLISNLRFWLRLRRSREVLKYSPPTLYVTEGIETPCLFGLFSPGIYVTPEVAEDKAALAHVLAHEQTHYRHKDHIWALLRCVCLVLHWYNPLVWLAAALSRRDGELACDEGAIRRLGEEHRAAYGRTLISLTCTRWGGLLRTATTMTGSKKSIKERIVLIARKPKMKVYTLIAVILIAAIAAGCTFTGREQTPEEGFLLCVDDLEDEVWGETFLAVCGKEDLTEDIFWKELMPILQGIEEGDFKGEPEADAVTDLEEPQLGVVLINAEKEAAMVRGGLYFTCLPEEGMLYTFRGGEYAIDEVYSYDGAVLLYCPELYRFIADHVKSPESPDPVEQYAQEMMEQHAAELSEQLDYGVSVGGVQSMELLNTGTAGANFSVQVYNVRYYLLHDLPESEDGSPVYGGVVSYTQYMFLLYQGDSVILLGHADETTLSNVYSTPEMIDKYENMYTAAAMEMYYRYQVERAFSEALLAHPDAVEVAYFDLNGDGWDEFIIKTGTCEADFEYVFYAYRNGVQGAEPIGREEGGHSYLAISEDGALIIAAGHMMVENAWRITWENGVFRSEQIISNRDASSDGYTNWPERLQTRIVNQGVVEKPRPSEPIGESGVGLTVEAESAKAAAEGFFMTYAEAELLFNGAVADCNVQYNEVLEISTDGNAVVGRFVYRVLPYEHAENHPDSSWTAGEGNYEGWYYIYPYFLLEKQADGLWHCAQWSADGSGLFLEDYGYQNGYVTAFQGVTKVYRCQETDPYQAAVKLATSYVEDLMVPDDMRGFIVTEYRNLKVSVTHTREVKADELLDEEVGENTWLVGLSLEYRFDGMLNDPPIGPGSAQTSEIWFDMTHQGSSLIGFLLTREGDEFIFQSRYDKVYP